MSNVKFEEHSWVGAEGNAIIEEKGLYDIGTNRSVHIDSLHNIDKVGIAIYEGDRNVGQVNISRHDFEEAVRLLKVTATQDPEGTWNKHLEGADANEDDFLDTLEKAWENGDRPALFTKGEVYLKREDTGAGFVSWDTVVIAGLDGLSTDHHPAYRRVQEAPVSEVKKELPKALVSEHGTDPHIRKLGLGLDDQGGETIYIDAFGDTYTYDELTSWGYVAATVQEAA